MGNKARNTIILASMGILGLFGLVVFIIGYQSKATEGAGANVATETDIKEVASEDKAEDVPTTKNTGASQRTQSQGTENDTTDASTEGTKAKDAVEVTKTTKTTRDNTTATTTRNTEVTTTKTTTEAVSQTTTRATTQTTTEATSQTAQTTTAAQTTQATTQSTTAASTQATTEATTQATTQATTSTSAPSTSATTEHTHNWKEVTEQVYVAEEGHYEEVEIAPAFENQRTEIHTFCGRCDFDYTAAGVRAGSVACPGCNETHGWYQRAVYVPFTEPAVYENQWIVDTPAHYETKVTGYKCSTCGATK